MAVLQLPVVLRLERALTPDGRVAAAGGVVQKSAQHRLAALNSPVVLLGEGAMSRRPRMESRPIGVVDERISASRPCWRRRWC